MVVALTEANKQFIQDNLVSRQDTDCEKWDGLERKYGRKDLLPMWIADMEFSAPKAIREALVKRVETGVYGYPLVPKGYFDSFVNWMQTRHQVTVKPEWIRFEVGVVKALYDMVAWLTKPGEPVVVMEPVYYPFMESIEDQGRKVVSVDLTHDNNTWGIDFDQLDKTLADPAIHVMIFCSPHNPVGRIWTEDELKQVLTIAQKHDVYVIADEIHQDFEIKGHFVSALAIDHGVFQKQLIVLNAASKTFNLAALRTGQVLIPNDDLRKRYDAFAKKAHTVEGTLLGQVAAEAGYLHGAQWFDQLLQVVRYNYAHMCQMFEEQAPGIKVADLQGTYLSFIDLGAYVKPEAMTAFVEGTCNLAVDYGKWFSKHTPTYVRFNLATDPHIVEEAAKRLIAGVKAQAK